MTQKQERLQHANDLIRVIASHGRRFFWHGGVNVYDPVTKVSAWESADRYASLELRHGRVYFIDDYTKKSVYTHKTGITNRWKGFSHGGTLRALVEDMRDYIIHGTKIDRWKIVIQSINQDDLTRNIWGYGLEAGNAVREAAYLLPIIERETV
jgi:hypothetical protein